MTRSEARQFRAGDVLDDLCRVCKSVRTHSVIAADPEGRPLRVICDYCGSQHNYRGGEERESSRTASSSSSSSSSPSLSEIQLVTERERRFPLPETSENTVVPDLELLLRRVIREESGLTPVAMAEKWREGDLVLRPADRNLQEKRWPIETFFHKVVMLRNRLRVLEQQINGMEIPEDAKVRLQSYITGCYGTLTSFNILFAEEEDRFRGTSGD